MLLNITFYHHFHINVGANISLDSPLNNKIQVNVLEPAHLFQSPIHDAEIIFDVEQLGNSLPTSVVTNTTTTPTTSTTTTSFTASEAMAFSPITCTNEESGVRYEIPKLRVILCFSFILRIYRV